MNLMNIRRIRRRKGLTIAELAEKSAMAYSTLWNIENEVSKPQSATLQKIADALEVSVGELVGEKDYEIERV